MWRVVLALLILPALADGPALTDAEYNFNEAWNEYLFEKVGCKLPKDTGTMIALSDCHEHTRVNYKAYLRARKYAITVFDLQERTEK